MAWRLERQVEPSGECRSRARERVSQPDGATTLSATTERLATRESRVAPSPRPCHGRVHSLCPRNLCYYSALRFHLKPAPHLTVSLFPRPCGRWFRACARARAGCSPPPRPPPPRPTARAPRCLTRRRRTARRCCSAWCSVRRRRGRTGRARACWASSCARASAARASSVSALPAGTRPRGTVLQAAASPRPRSRARPRPLRRSAGRPCAL